MTYGKQILTDMQAADGKCFINPPSESELANSRTDLPVIRHAGFFVNSRLFAKTSAVSTTTRVLSLSMRRLADLVAYSAAYEFEDVVEAVTDTDRVEPRDAASLEFSRRAYRYLRLFSRSRSLATRLMPRP